MVSLLLWYLKHEKSVTISIKSETKNRNQKYPNFSFSDSQYKHDTRMDKQYKAQASMQMYDNAISLIHKWKLKIKS